MSHAVPQSAATAFGTTKKEAGDNLIISIREYLKIYPEKHGEIFNGQTREFSA